jgi:hypothetical protein
MFLLGNIILKFHYHFEGLIQRPHHLPGSVELVIFLRYRN